MPTLVPDAWSGTATGRPPRRPVIASPYDELSFRAGEVLFAAPAVY
jgi:hypothetical protein